MEADLASYCFQGPPMSINVLIARLCLQMCCALKLANNAGLCALSQRVGNETSCSGKPSRQLRDQRDHGPEETASVRRCIPHVEWFHFPLALGCIFSPPRKKIMKIYSQAFHMQTLKMKKRACVLSFILHKPFTWKRGEKKHTWKQGGVILKYYQV